MKTNMQQTSLLAYQQLNNLTARQRLVYNAISTLGTACNLNVSDYLHLPINSITPRVKELREKGLVEESHRDIHPATQRVSIYWRVSAEVPS